MNNRMAYRHLGDGHANLLQPRKRVRQTMNAPMIIKDGRLWCVLARQAPTIRCRSTFRSRRDDGLWLRPAASGRSAEMVKQSTRSKNPIFHIRARSNSPSRDALTLKSPPNWRPGSSGLRVDDLGGPCNVEAIRVLENGVRMAGSDPRRDGWALAYSSSAAEASELSNLPCEREIAGSYDHELHLCRRGRSPAICRAATPRWNSCTRSIYDGGSARSNGCRTRYFRPLPPFEAGMPGCWARPKCTK